MMNNRKRFIFALLLPLVILLSMTIKPLSATFSGHPIVLDTEPVDPTDLFYGDYVILNLEINSVPASKISEGLLQEMKKKERDDYWADKMTVYSVLEEKEGVYTVKEVTEQKPENDIYLKGRMYVYSDMPDDAVHHIDYGLNRFYLEENTGTAMEAKAQQGKLRVNVKVKDGYGIIEALQSE